MVFFHQDPAKARTVDQIEGLLFIRKELQGGVFGVIHYVPRFVQGKIHLPEQSRGNIHRPAEPAQFLFFRQQRLLVHAHSYPRVRLIEEDRFLTTPSYYIYHTQERRSSSAWSFSGSNFIHFERFVKVSPCESPRSSIPSKAKAGSSAHPRFLSVPQVVICAVFGATRPTRHGLPREKIGPSRKFYGRSVSTLPVTSS